MLMVLLSTNHDYIVEYRQLELGHRLSKLRTVDRNVGIAD